MEVGLKLGEPISVVRSIVVRGGGENLDFLENSKKHIWEGRSDERKLV